MLNLFKKNLPELINRLEQEFIILDNLGPEIQVLLRYSNRAKHISIRISHNGPELVLPNKNLAAGKRFLLTKEDWIRRKLQNAGKYNPIDNNSIPLFGEIHYLEYITATKPKVTMSQGLIQIYSKPGKHKEHLIKFLKEMLLEEIIDMAEFIKNKHNIQFDKIKIMNNKTRWGSCSSKKIIAFNWRLIFAHKEILDYLVVHEMCHLVHMNHSKKFWDLVEKIYPDYKAAKLWLRKNGRKLHLYLPT